MSETPTSIAPVHVRFAHTPTVNFALQQNHVPVVRSLSVTNAGPDGLADIDIRIWSEPAFFEPWQTRIDHVPSQGTHNINTIDLVPSAEFLMSLTEAITGTIHADVARAGALQTRQSTAIELLAYDDWSGLDRALPDILAAFVLPNHPQVQAVLSEAATLLASWTQDGSLSGYQSKDRTRVAAMAAAIFSAIQALGIRYSNPPASFERTGQKVRLPEAILTHKLATCLDLSLLAAACLEQAGLHPLIVMTRGHAFVGLWLVEECFADAATDEPLRLRKRVDLNEILVFETTLLASTSPATFKQAMDSARAKLADLDQFESVVDIQRCRKNRIRPLPIRTTGGQPSEQPVPIDYTPPTAHLGELEMASASAIEATTERESPETRLDRWKRKLLDLTLHNRLINFKESKKTLPLLCPDLSALEDALFDGDRFSLACKPSEMGKDDPRNAELHRLRTGEDALRQVLLAEFGERRLRTALTQEELDRRTSEIFRTARTSMEEGGANSLYLALGFLAWYESKSSDQRRLAPIILLPVELQRNSMQEGFRVRQTDEEPRINVTLLELLAKDYDLSITGLDPIPQDEKGIDVKGIFSKIRQATKDIDRWDVIEQAQIGLFSFTKFLMWRDLEVRTAELLKNRVVNHLVYHAHERFQSNGDFPNPDRLDQDYKPETTYCPLPSDSSQLAAVYSAAQDRSFVLFGPPGTGKSQSITNLIAHCLALGKTVLFVSEKMAALNVVQRRLAQVGLAPYCLELHSNKTHKMKVIEQLGQALGRATQRSGEDWTREAQRLGTVRQELNDYVQALHRPRSTGESAFRAMSQLIGLQDAPLIQASWTSPDAITRDRLDQLRDLVDQMTALGQACGHPKGHVWSGVRCTELGPLQQREIEQAITRLAECVTRVEAAAKSAGEALGIGGTNNLSTLEFTAKFAKFLLSSPRPPAGLLTETDFAAAEAALKSWRGHAERRDALEAKLFTRYRDDLLTLDVDSLRALLTQAQARWALPRWWVTRGIKNQLAAFAKDRKALLKTMLSGDLNDACSLRDERQQLAMVDERANKLLAQHWQSARPDWSLIDRFREWCGTFRKFAAAIGGGDAARGAAARERWIRLITEGADSLAPNGSVGALCTTLVQTYVAFSEAKQALEAKLILDTPATWMQDSGAVTLDSIRAKLAEWSINLKTLRPWSNWQAIRKEAIDAGLDALIAALERDGMAFSSLRRAFDRSFYQWWVEAIIDQDSLLRKFNGVDHDRRIQRFRDLDRRFMELTTSEIQARLAARQPTHADQVNQNSELGILRHQLQRRRGHMPVRALFHKIPNLLPRLKPCLLMSPNSVAQYLDPAFPKFDLVVFDEASQIPAWDAVGAIARGNEVVVVGDPKQLPPTNFFNRADGDPMDDDDLVEDLESILDDCIAGQLPQMELRWHYRSRHESLIAFSNYYYYDNQLLTFPSPHIDQGVKFQLVSGGHYDRGKSRTNSSEAEAVVAEVLRRLRHPELSKRSIGIVTFSVAQQTLVEDKLDEARRAYPEIDSFFTDAVTEPIFIKNLENVQGDERDVILFSICYGPDLEGRISLNFGPLNRDGGERRLNVAITRARHELIIFSTLRAEQIDLSRSRARGVQDLRCFLDFAERGRAAITEALTIQGGADFESPFEKQVCEALRHRGHQVHTQVGCSGYRVDLAVVDPAIASRYLLGIECDGANYHSAKTARDRDKLRESVLMDLGWRIHRVWSSDWWADPEVELSKIEAAIEKSVSSRSTAAAPAPDTLQYASAELAPNPPAGPTKQHAAIPVARGHSVYAPTSIHASYGTADEFYDARSNDAIKQVIRKVVEGEGPISLDLLARRVLSHWRLSRRTEAAMDRIEQLISSSSIQSTRRNHVLFLWPSHVDHSAYDSFRVNGDKEQTKRDSADIPPEEIASAARHILRSQVSLPRDELVREVGRLFGFQRVGAGIVSHMAAGIDLLIQSGGAKQCDGSVLLA